MINKQCSYTCSVKVDEHLISFSIIPNLTVFQIGERYYYLDKNEYIIHVENNIPSIFKTYEDLEIKRVNLLNRIQMLFLRKVYKLLNCKFSFTFYKNSITFRDVERKVLMTINNCEIPFHGLVFYSIEILESEGIFNDIL